MLKHESFSLRVFLSPEDAAMKSDHERLEERSIALHREIAKRLEENPQLVDLARANLERWIARDGELPPWREWRKILGWPFSQLISFLLSRDEVSKRLRQSSPFCGILAPKERWHIYESFTVGAYYKGVGQHRG